MTFIRNVPNTTKVQSETPASQAKVARDSPTVSHRALREKEMIVNSSLMLSQFSGKRSAPFKYDRSLVAAAVKAMERVEGFRQRKSAYSP
jgi:hypothetical protein